MQLNRYSFFTRWLQVRLRISKHQWINSSLVLLLGLCCTVPTLAQVPAAERQALLDFYNATNGPNWISENDADPANDWDFSGPVTEDWEGVELAAGSVRRLRFYGNGIDGEIPGSIGAFSNLELFSAVGNNLSGTIPQEITQLINLDALVIVYTNVSGSLPTNLCNLSELRILQLSGNQLSGQIPEDIGCLTKLIDLYLSENNFSGQIPESIGGLSQLRLLELNQNDLTGTVPASMGNLGNLNFLNMSSNKLTGQLPTNLAALISLKNFNVSGNNLNGELPSYVGTWPDLFSLNFANNQYTGSIPETYGFLTKVEDFNVYRNQLDGPIPNWFVQYGQLVNIDLADNNFSGPVPDLSNLPNLERFAFDTNKFQFGEFEDQLANYGATVQVVYNPQERSAEITNVQVGIDAPLVLTADVSGSQNHYQWYKDGVLIPGAPDSANFSISRAKETDTGVYYCKVTSDLVPNLTIDRNVIYVTVAGEAPARSVTGQNNIYTRNYQEERTTVPNAKFLSDDGYIQEIAYFDGLGRPEQQIAIRQSPNKKDIVTFTDYDDYGRQAKQWLPIPEPDAPLGSYRFQDLEEATKLHYKIAYADDFEGVALELINPYSEQKFETSPLNRVDLQAAPGEDWKMGNGHEIETDYSANVVNEVRRFSTTLAYSEKTYNTGLAVDGFYPAGELTKTIVRDENHSGTSKAHTVEEFKDKQGRVLLKRTYGEVSRSSTVQALDTYYVYDDYGNLSYVLPPLMEPQTASLAALNSSMEELGYRYIYDQRNRVVQKWVPGKSGWDYMVYNNLDQLVLTQDPNLRANNEWLFTKYDAFGRIAYTGIMVNAQNRENIQAEVSALANGLWVYRSTAAINVGVATLYYTNTGYPTTGISAVHTINYYDSYANLDLPAGAPASPTILGSSPARTATDKLQGLLTYSKVRVLDVPGADNWINTVLHYDDKAREVYSYTENAFLGTTDIAETQLDFVGRPVKVRTIHIKAGNTIVTLDNFTYDHTGRLLAQTQCIGDAGLGAECPAQGGTPLPSDLDLTGQTVNTLQQATNSIFMANGLMTPGGHLLISPNSGVGSGEELIFLNEYDELGLLVQKKVGGEATGVVGSSLGLQEMLYDYNIRGWLKEINNVDDATPDKLFNFKMTYNEGPNALYNGNISGTKWRTANTDSSLKSYDYSYDALNRIISAIDDTGNYNVSNITYDRNGNILTLNRKGHTNIFATTFGNMDNLVYTYGNGNQLGTVSDNGSDTFGFKDGANVASEYTYDANGNMTSDANKGIPTDGIEYNFLDMPTKITVSNGSNTGILEYRYTADGTKVQKVKKDLSGTVLTTTDYNGNHIYENGTLQFFNHAEGYATPKNVNDYSQGFDYVYNYWDHLGNVRLSYTDNNGTLEIVEENNFYPFGMRHQGYNGNVSPLGNSFAKKFRYQNQELNNSLGYNMYEFELRHYDPAIGRFVTTDPYEQFMSPYLAMGNNPVVSIDPDGGLCYDVNGNVVACPDGEEYDDYRDNQNNHINILEGVTLTPADSNPVAETQEEGLAGKRESIIPTKYPSIYELEGLEHTIAEIELNLTGVRLIETDFGAVEVDANGNLIRLARLSGSGNMSLIGGGPKRVPKVKVNTNSVTRRQAFRKAKAANKIPRSKQPDKVYNVREKGTGKTLKVYEYTNSSGKKILIRGDNAKIYKDGGIQGRHFNAGEKGTKLKQHHYYDN